MPNNQKMPNNDRQKGVALIITFFIMVIILAVVTIISVLLYNQLRIAKNIADSVIAFYAAESGVEKTLYYDKKVVPAGGLRGICDIETSCPEDLNNPGEEYCNNVEKVNNIEKVGDHCSTQDCTDCIITFETMITDKKTYSVTAVVSQDNQPDYYVFDITSRGFNQKTSRAIMLRMLQELAPEPPPEE